MRVHCHLPFLRSSSTVAATFIYLCYIFLSSHRVLTPSCFPVFVFPSMQRAPPPRCRFPLRAPLLRSRPVPCVRYARSASISLARICMHALVFICARALSHLPLYSLLRSRPVPCVRYASRIHSTLVAVVFDCRSPSRVIVDSLTVVSGLFRDLPHRSPSSVRVLRQHGRHAAATAASPCVAAVVASPFRLRPVRRRRNGRRHHRSAASSNHATVSDAAAAAGCSSSSTASFSCCTRGLTIAAAPHRQSLDLQRRDGLPSR